MKLLWKAMLASCAPLVPAWGTTWGRGPAAVLARQVPLSLSTQQGTVGEVGASRGWDVERECVQGQQNRYVKRL